jgi:hypothetical protein
MTHRMTPPVQLLAYEFAPGAEYEGRLVGAIECIESGGTLRIIDVLFVMRDADTDEPVAIESAVAGRARSWERCSAFGSTQANRAG